MKSIRSLFAHARLIAGVAVLLVLGLSTESLAVPITVPTGLNPGDQYRLVFLTTGTTAATQTNIAYYDALVQAEADAVAGLLALGTTWQVIGSSSAGNAISHTGTSGTGVPIYLLNDTRLVNNYVDLWDGSVDIPLNVDSSGSVVGAVQVWTGTFLNGTTNGNRWLGSTSGQVSLGSSNQTGGGWVGGFADAAIEQRHLYAISAVQTVPEPGTGLLLSLGLLGLAARGRRRKV